MDKALDEQVEAGIAYATAANRLDQIMSDLRTGAYVEVPTVGTGDDGKTKAGRSGPTPEELAAQREMLSLQAKMGLLQAQGREDEARAIQRQIDLINL
ncbi:hypothetical protein OB03_14375, partial [Brevundimonas sp. GN22]